MQNKYQQIYNNLSEQQKARVQEEYQRAYEFDRKDPRFGLSRQELSGPKLSRRAFLRLMAASGASLSLGHLLAAAGITLPMVSRVAAQAGGELTCGWGGVGEILTLDPAQINQVLQFQITSNVLSGLTHINADLIAEGDLAADWSVSEDGLEWTFNLREGVKWHNGDDFTADDVLFTYNRSKDPNQSIHSGNLVNVADVVKVDDFTVRIVMSKPQASFLVKTLERASGRAMTMVNRRAIEEMGLEQYGLTPVGTGPFMVTEHEVGQSVVIEKFAEYFDPERPLLDKVTFLPILDPEPLAAAIETGDIQLIGGNGAPFEMIPRFLANPDLVVSQVPGPGFQSLFVNPWREPFMVPDFNISLDELKAQNGFKVRLALAKAYDRALVIERGLFGLGLPAFGSINPAMGFFFDTGINDTSEQRFDLEAARALLAEAGFPNGEGFRPLEYLTTPAGQRVGQIVAQMYKDNLNIDIELVVKDFTVLIVDNNRMEFDLTALGSGGDYDPDDGLVDWMISTSRFNGPNRNDEDLLAARDGAELPFGFFADARVDELIAQQATESDLDARKALVQEANKITSDKVATIFTWHGIDSLVYRTEVNFPDASRIPGLVDLDRVSIG